MQRWYVCEKCGNKFKEGQGAIRWDATCEKCGGSLEYLAYVKRKQKELKTKELTK